MDDLHLSYIILFFLNLRYEPIFLCQIFGIFFQNIRKLSEIYSWKTKISLSFFGRKSDKI
jgi:hypothetical protein